MSQYEVAKYVFTANSGKSVREIARHFNLARATVREDLKCLERKGYIIKEQKRYIPQNDISKEDIEDLRPPTLDELME